MITPPKVTVIIPTYNCARYIGEAVDSVLAQTYPVHEILVVDDGSTDNTRDVLSKYREPVRYIPQKNAGPPAARNNGILQATGDYIAFLDSDDLWLPHKLQAQMECFQQHPEYGMVYCDMKTFDDTGILEESVKITRHLTYYTGDIFPQLFAETIFQTSALVVRRTCFDKVGLLDTTLPMGDDYEIFLRLARYYHVGCVDEPLILYRQHPSQGTRTWGKQLQQGTPWEVKVLQNALKACPGAEKELGRTTVRHRLSKPYFTLAYAYLGEGEHRQARSLLAGALKLWPTNLGYIRYYLMTFFSPAQLAKIRDYKGSSQPEPPKAMASAAGQQGTADK